MSEQASGDGAVPDPQVGGGDGLTETLPGLARLYAAAWWHATEWTLSSSLHAASRLARSAARGETPAELAGVAADELRDYARRVRATVDPDGDPGERPGDGPRRPDAASISSLRSRGEELLRLSADINYEEETHPAYGRILSQLAPDEARILRLLTVQGPQPAIDVRAGLPLASSMIAPGRTMIGAEAGCRYLDRVPAYLNNLYRLGLIWFSREPLSDRLRYQVLEAQPDVLEAMTEGGRTARTVRRSIVLTPFGRDFCELVLPAGEPGAAPEDGA